jgi:exosortase D (VPLPA-CTERM-specific)
MKLSVAPPSYRFSITAIMLLLVLAAAIYSVFAKAIAFMVGQWGLEEFSHGYLIPFVSAYLLWQRRFALRRMEFHGAWAGCLVVLAGIGLAWLGRLAALYALQHLALLVVVAGTALALAGWRALRVMAVPLGALVFMIPLPNVLLNTVSAQLQLISSTLGVGLIRLFGVAVFLEGNVIDLGAYRLEVADACSGLRYLLPLMTLGFLMSCFYRAPLWRRFLLFLSTLPVTLVMNSLRIAAIGVMVDRWGPAMAEGLVHQVQGWMMFMLCVGVLVIEIAILQRLSAERRPLREVLGLDVPLPAPGPGRAVVRAVPAPLVAATLLALGFAATAAALPVPPPHVPQRRSFSSFPVAFAGRIGHRQAMERVYLDTLKLDDYLLADYARDGALPLNLYVAWYDTQSAGEATHSPRACLPGGGWRIESMRQVEISPSRPGNSHLRVNRALIQAGDRRQIVYYWFMQRGRLVTSEYMVKWYLLVDSLRRHRSDGALVRLMVPLPQGASEPTVDAQLSEFADEVARRLPAWVPG